MRKPIAADRFYEGEPVKLYEQVKSFLVETKEENVKVAICPHAGYVYSGRCAGEVYSRFMDNGSKETETVILLGPNHSGKGYDISFSNQNFLMPFGRMNIDLDLANLIMENCQNRGLDVGVNEPAHNSEHSLEVQLPFIQNVFNKNIKLVPIILNELNYEGCIKLAISIYQSINKSKRKVKVIISSDFTHYGDEYGFVPFKDDIKTNLYRIDEPAVKAILEFNSKEFYELSKYRTICGMFAITAGIELARLLKCTDSEKVCFYNSGDVTGNYENSVNYAGIIFK